MMSFNVPNIFLMMLFVGICSFGGGPGAISVIKDIVLSNAWLGEKEYIDLVTFSQINPMTSGIIMSAYVGAKHSFLGAAAAVTGIALPGILLMLLIVFLGKRFYADKRFQYTVKFINLLSVAVICSLAYSMITMTFSNDPIVYIALAALTCYFNLRFEIKPALLIGIGTIFGLIWRA